MFGHKVLLAFVAILSLLVAAPPIITQESLSGPGFVSFDIETKTVRWATVPGVHTYVWRAWRILSPDDEPEFVYAITNGFVSNLPLPDTGFTQWEGFEAGNGYIITVYAVSEATFRPYDPDHIPGPSATTSYIPPAWRSFYASITTSDLQNLLLGSYLDFFPLGAIGKAFRVSETQIDFYEIIEGTTQGVLALRITQEEVDEALEEAGEATCVKASKNDRASVTVWADGNVTFSIGPDYETKIFHVLLEGGLDGEIIGHSTTYGPPAGAHCAN